MTEPEPSRLDVVKTMHRSVSQLTSFRDCGYRYYLERVERAWQRPAAWFAQGTAVHRAAELWELTGRRMTLEEAQAVYSTAYSADVNEALAESPNMTEWFSSGQYDGEADIERRFGIGLEQTAKYVAYYTDGKGADDRPWKTPSGELAIELPFEIDLDGVIVRGYIDAVMESPKRGLVVRDNKTGNQPGKPLQLKVYGAALRRQYGAEPTNGDFWMGKTGSVTRSPVALSEADDEDVIADFATMDEAVKREQFEPKPGEQCQRCGVATSCPFAVR